MIEDCALFQKNQMIFLKQCRLIVMILISFFMIYKMKIEQDYYNINW